MDSILRALATYVFLLLVFRVSGKRALAEITSFDAVLLLIISESIQQALLDGDESMTNSFLIVLTLIGANVLLEHVGTRSTKVDKFLNDVPLLLIEDGHTHQDRLKRVRVTEDDILEQARAQLGVERMEQIKYAILERSGGITVIPKYVPWANPDMYKQPTEAPG